MKSSSHSNPHKAYHAYLLKVWLETDGEISKSAWHFSLEDVASGARRGFTDLDSLWVYLQNLTGERGDPAGPA